MRNKVDRASDSGWRLELWPDAAPRATWRNRSRRSAGGHAQLLEFGALLWLGFLGDPPVDRVEEIQVRISGRPHPHGSGASLPKHRLKVPGSGVAPVINFLTPLWTYPAAARRSTSTLTAIGSTPTASATSPTIARSSPS
jgi:hypothetical protein